MGGTDAGAWSVERRGDAVWVTMRGLLTEENVLGGPSRFLDLLGDGAHVVFDVREVTAYSSGVRGRWQRALRPHRDRIRSLTVISDSQLTRMGAFMFATFLGLDCRVVASPDEL